MKGPESGRWKSSERLERRESTDVSDIHHASLSKRRQSDAQKPQKSQPISKSLDKMNKSLSLHQPTPT
jgi:hypothetical protein